MIKHKHIHLIGIGGISMSGLAEILLSKGHIITGSDINTSNITKRLESKGITIYKNHKKENLLQKPDLVVYTAAIKKDNPEYEYAISLNIPTIDRAELLDIILNDYKNIICIAGSHGKTSTTAILTDITVLAEYDPTVSIGGVMSNGLNYRVGKNELFILEACEYSGSFLKWKPDIGIILNTDADHLDFYGDINNIIKAFNLFAKNIKNTLIINSYNKYLYEIINDVNCNIIYFNTSENYNISNANAASEAARIIGIDEHIIKTAVDLCKGVKRRYEYKGLCNGANIIDDYAHHPTEIRACLKAARQNFNGRIIVVFCPHTYSRTKYLFEDFSKSFELADLIITVPIYAAREAFDASISSGMLAENIKKTGKLVYNFFSYKQTIEYLLSEIKEGDLLITMGAGDVNIVAEGLLST